MSNKLPTTPIAYPPATCRFDWVYCVAFVYYLLSLQCQTSCLPHPSPPPACFSERVLLVCQLCFYDVECLISPNPSPTTYRFEWMLWIVFFALFCRSRTNVSTHHVFRLNTLLWRDVAFACTHHLFRLMWRDVVFACTHHSFRLNTLMWRDIAFACTHHLLTATLAMLTDLRVWGH